MLDTRRFLSLYRGRIMAFLADQSGAVIPLVTVSIITMIGLATLAIDLSRLMDLQTQLQKAADAFALAGAAELDGGADAITRADAAIDTLMASRNSDIWGGGAVTVASRTYHSVLPATDDLAMGGGGATAANARYVEVAVAPVTVNTFLPATLLGAADSTLTTGATAVAGFNQVACKTTPLFICNPYEGSSPGIDADAHVGKMLVLKKGPAGNSPTPGNYGFLAVDGNGAKVLKDALGASDSGACFNQEGVTTEPGNVASASDWLNIRFDLFSASASGKKNDADYPPAPNVRKGCLPDKGAAGNTCGQDYDRIGTYCQNGSPHDDPAYVDRAMRLPTDATFDYTTGVGNGVWDLALADYWSINHTGEALPSFPQNFVNPTRYDAYAYEIDGRLGDPAAAADPPAPHRSPGITEPAGTGNKVKGESGAPSCSTVPAGDKNRRIIYVAVIDCAQQGLGGGKQSNVYVKAFAKFFLLRPVSNATGNNAEDQSIYGEFLGIVERGDGSGVLHDIVQLVR